MLYGIIICEMKIKRAIEEVVGRLSEQFPVILVTGARQVGKTTLLRMLATPDRRFVSFDDPELRAMARTDPKLFFQSYPPPIVLDEIQYVPELLTQIKIMVDANREANGQFWLTGSQPFRLMKGVNETLAGRVAILPLGGIGQAEECSRSVGAFRTEMQSADDTLFDDGVMVYKRIVRGSFPDLVSGRIKDREIFYRSYVQTYIERDIRDLMHIGNEAKFLAFLRVMAGRTGQLLNLSDVARDVGISPVTARSWLSLLETSGIVFLLRPYSRNVTARIVKTPKLYFMDTGLAAYLSGWRTEDTLMNGAMSGAFLETFVVAEIVKRAWNAGEEPQMYFYRDNAGTEIDVLLEQDGVLHPLEVKKSASPSLSDARAFGRVVKKGLTLGTGAVLCLSQRLRPLDRDVMVMPIGAL